jgi:hypothetical protein
VAVQCANSSRAPQPVTGAFAASAGPSRLGLWQKSRKETPTRPRLASQRRELAVLYGRVTRAREDARAFAGRHERERLVSPGPKALAARPWYWPRPRAWLTSHCEIETNLYSLVGGSGLTGERGLRQGRCSPYFHHEPGPTVGSPCVG